MRRYKFSDLLQYENRVRKLFDKYELGFNSTNRIVRYFKYLREIEENRQLNKQEFGKILQKDKAKYYYSQFYVLEICNLIDALERRPQDLIIIKNKLADLAKGTYLLSEENSADTRARDTTFELSLFSFLQSRGLDVDMCEPNPDLRLKSEKFVYEVECKRPQSIKSLEKSIKKAARQLRKSTGNDVVPTIALSLDQILFKGNDLILDSKDEASASNFLNATLEVFLRDNLKMLQKVIDKDSCLVLYYLSCLVGFKTNVPMANATFITGNVYNFENQLSHTIYGDLNALIPQSSL
ncbi:hypothetical protein KKF92_00105 [Patescibacteria group bacterium]|nr:hypothetical protein [Patescibacteria group bacterium]